MAIYSEVIHTIKPATPKAMADYAKLYAETAYAMLERSGFDVIGVWKWSTGTIGRDLMISRFESAEHQAECSLKVQAEIAAGGVEGLTKSALKIEEHLASGMSLPYATDEQLRALQNSSPTKPRQYLILRMKTELSNVRDTIEALAKRAEAHQGPGAKLAASYMMTSGARGSFTEIWALEQNEVGDLSFDPRAQNSDVDDELARLLQFSSVDLINPLPYSKLQ